MIVDSFCKVDSTLRIVIATTAFGMGVNVPNINIIVHWGAPHNIQGYMQQSGHAGRDGTQSLSIIYYHPSDISTVATDTQTREFCLLQSCRRKFLIQQFTPEAQSTYSVLGSCLCCDNCKPTCRCGACLLDPPAIIEFDESLTKFAQLFDETIMREVHDQQRTEIKDELLHLRTKLVGNSCASLLNVGMITGLSDKVINDIVTNVHYIFSIDDIMSQYVFERKTAGEVFDIIDNVLSD
ncbi:hypothetical protein FSP39_006474 [Pinctada imbricata]|uniref:DNA 3'-5' helicase n=1 Tax=Pinctada imbricata TaxID=66713 RepID=A0AA89BYW4_PINIB|nr:hypothetical protein FSP39_006474 [Pinctada imbricata]